MKTLYTLLDSHRIADLASAIEAVGIHGPDRFGRPRHFKPDSPEVQAALEALATEYRWERGMMHDDERFEYALLDLHRATWTEFLLPQDAPIKVVRHGFGEDVDGEFIMSKAQSEAEWRALLATVLSMDDGHGAGAMSAEPPVGLAFHSGLKAPDVPYPGDPLFLYGWPDDQCPDIGEVVIKENRQSSQTRADNTLLRLLVALAAEHGIDVTSDNAAKLLHQFLELRGDKPPALNTLKSIVGRARDVAEFCEIITTRTRRQT